MTSRKGVNDAAFSKRTSLRSRSDRESIGTTRGSASGSAGRAKRGGGSDVKRSEAHFDALRRRSSVGRMRVGATRMNLEGRKEVLQEETESTNIREGFEAIVLFRRSVRVIQILVRATISSKREQELKAKKEMSFAQLKDEMTNNKHAFFGTELTFDPTEFCAVRDTRLTLDAQSVLSMTPGSRSDEQEQLALKGLKSQVEAFAEFPIKMQKSLVRRGWYENFEAKRVIIRQGHMADNFYFILSGTTVVTVVDAVNGGSHSVAQLGRGNSFGELALMRGARRSATVTCKEEVELLCVHRDDFVDIFMHVEKDKQPEHITFMQNEVKILQGWPMEKLPWNDPTICLFTYFRRGTVMCKDSNDSEWIYVIKTGCARVLKCLPTTLPNHATDTRRDTALKNATLDMPRAENGGKAKPLRLRSDEELTSSRDEHLQQLNSIFAIHELNRKSTEDDKKLHNNNHNGPVPAVFVEIQKLGPRDTFGLEAVAFNMMEACTSVALVSEGTEAVLISKKFFLQNLNDEEHKKLRTTIQPYPSKESMQRKLNDQIKWDAFKSSLVSDYMCITHSI